MRAAVERYRDLLHRAKRRGPLDYVAWITRNILELRIWVEYCSQSPERATDFYFDCVRDLNDLNRGHELDDQTLAALKRATALLDPARPPHKYTNVRAAAEQIGMLKRFENDNKVLSKFVHPTALSVILPIKEPSAESIRKQMVSSGEATAREALDQLASSTVGQIYRTYAPFINRVNAALPKHKRVC